ncbi:MAG TPA: hypothetical protein VEB64_09875 [Azospirillaceae bacterium]|nr:hypothetical protein [Azospirillaceae bacterium]
MADHPSQSAETGGPNGATRTSPAVILPPWQARVQPRPANDNKAPLRLRVMRGGVAALLIAVLVAMALQYLR